MLTLDPAWRKLATTVAVEVAAILRKKSPPVAAEWLDVPAAAAYLSLTEKALRMRLYKDGAPPSHRVGKLLRFKRSELDDWVRDEK